MPTADKLEWGQGNPLFEVMFRALSEGDAGNGILAPGDFQVTAIGTTARGVAVAPGDLWYNSGTVGTAAEETHTLTAGDATNDRWDTVVFDTALGTTAVREGTPAASPEPPDVAGDDFPLAFVYVPTGATDIPDSQILNWRAFSQTAARTRLDDANGYYSSTDVEAAFAEAFETFVNVGGDDLSGPLDLSGFAGSSPFDLGTNPGAFGPLVDAVVDGNSVAGTAHSYTLAIDGTTLVTFYAESDGAGGVQNVRVDLEQTLRVGGDILTTAGTTIWDSTAGEVPQNQLGGPAASLSSYPLPIGDLSSPYGLPDITDRDLNGTSLADSAGPGTLYSAIDGKFKRGVLDDERITTTHTASGTNTGATTTGEEVVLVDTATNAAPFTTTLASADVAEGNVVLVSDSGGGADANPITVATEGTETIDDATTWTIDVAYGSVSLVSDGVNWFTAGGGTGTGGGEGLTADSIATDSSGTVAAGTSGVVHITSLADTETVEFTQATLLLADGTPAPTDLDLILATLDNLGGGTKQTTILAGDGSTVHADATGNPLVSYQNTSGGEETIAVLVDNGDFNVGTGASQEVMAAAIGGVS